MAVLMGLVVQCCTESSATEALRAAWRRYLVTTVCMIGAIVLAVGVAAIVCPRYDSLETWAEPPLVALAYSATSIGLAVLLLRLRRTTDPTRVRLAIFALAGFMSLTFTGVVTNIRQRRAADPALAMRQLKERLPPGQTLVSLGGHVCPLFPYYYGLPFVTSRPWPVPGSDQDLTYFCVQCSGDSPPVLPFAWKQIGIVPLDRNQHRIHERMVIVGLRVPEPQDGTTGLVRGEEGASGRR